MVDSALAIAQPTTERLPPPTDFKPSPPIPPRVVGAKRKFVEDKSTYSHTINPARKIINLPYVLYSTVMHPMR
jgi:hypothetical protein